MTEIYFFSVVEAGSPRSSSSRFWFPVRPLFLTCRWWLCSVHICLSSVYACGKRTGELSGVSVYENTPDLDPNLMTSFKLNYLFTPDTPTLG